MIDYNNIIIDICDKISQLDKTTEEMNTQLGVQDKKLSDLYHLIEFGQVGLHPMIIYSELMKVLAERRHIKNQIGALTAVFAPNAHFIFPNLKQRTYMRNQAKNRQNLLYANRVYTPEFTELRKEEENE